MKRKLLIGSLLSLVAAPSFAQVGMDIDTTREQQDTCSDVNG
ncbi:MAG: hypothetical protein RL440_1547 [Bacteroidota bacterium]